MRHGNLMAKKSEISGAFDIQKSMDALLLDEMSCIQRC
jgi:hypothetical protein